MIFLTSMKCELKGIDIRAISTYLPANVLEMVSLNEVFGEKEVRHTILGSGIERLHVADDSQTSLDLCYEAAENLIHKDNIDRSAIDGLIMVSQTFDYLGPASSIILQDKLGLSKDIVCFDIVYGCSGYIYGIYQASLLISSGSCNNVLLLNGETNSHLIDKSDKNQIMVFGDCGSATLIGKGEGALHFHICSDGSGHRFVRNMRGGERAPILIKNGEIPLDKKGNPILTINDGTAVFDFIIHCGPQTIRTMLDYVGWDKDEVDFYALHQATKVTIDFMRKRLRIDKNKSPFNLSNYGNTSSTTIPLVITSYVHDNNIDTSTWRKVIMSAYGIGLSWGSIACDLSKTRIYEPINK